MLCFFFFFVRNIPLAAFGKSLFHHIPVLCSESEITIHNKSCEYWFVVLTIPGYKPSVSFVLASYQIYVKISNRIPSRNFQSQKIMNGIRENKTHCFIGSLVRLFLNKYWMFFSWMYLMNFDLFGKQLFTRDILPTPMLWYELRLVDGTFHPVRFPNCFERYIMRIRIAPPTPCVIACSTQFIRVRDLAISARLSTVQIFHTCIRVARSETEVSFAK